MPPNDTPDPKSPQGRYLAPPTQAGVYEPTGKVCFPGSLAGSHGYQFAPTGFPVFHMCLGRRRLQFLRVRSGRNCSGFSGFLATEWRHVGEGAVWTKKSTS